MNKKFGLPHLEYESGANSPTINVQEVTEQTLLADIYKPDQDLLDFLANSQPGNYLTFRGRVVFRIS